MPSTSPPHCLLSARTGRGAAVIALACLLGLAGCGDRGAAPAAAAASKGAPAAAAPPPPAVGVVVATPGEVGLVTELPGRVEAVRVSQVRARAAGILQERLFREGSDVKAGTPLFRIDPAPYEAALRSAEATLARAEANAAQASSLANRYKPLVAANAVSKQDYANAVAAQKAGEADVAAGRAAVTTARINLGHATVTAPISGRIGRALVTEGALVGQGEATPLAVIQQIDAVYVNFTQSSNDVLRLRRAMQAGELARASGADAASVRIVLDDGTEYPHPGKLLFSDLSVDPTSGQVTLRAEVPNAEGLLLPGLYVRVRLEQAQATNAITVPQQAVTRTDRGDYLYVVADDNKVGRRDVRITAARGGRWIVAEGLKPGEKVVVDGFQRLQMMPPNATVNPVPWTDPTAPTASVAAPGAAARAR